MHAFNPNRQISVNLRLAWSKEKVPGQRAVIQRNPVSKNKMKTKIKEKKRKMTRALYHKIKLFPLNVTPFPCPLHPNDGSSYWYPTGTRN